MDNKLKTVDAETLLSTPMSKTMFIVDGLISQGVNVISGASKIGKSWLMLWLGLQVAQGNSIWGLPTLQCNVLYYAATEEELRRTIRQLRSRIKKIAFAERGLSRTLPDYEDTGQLSLPLEGGDTS